MVTLERRSELGLITKEKHSLLGRRKIKRDTKAAAIFVYIFFSFANFKSLAWDRVYWNPVLARQKNYRKPP